MFTDYSIRAVESFSEFEALQSDWDHLVGLSDGGSLFMSWAWLAAAWKAAPAGASPVIILVERAGRMVAAAPLLRQKTLYYRAPVNELTFLGDDISDRQEFLCDPEETEALAALWNYIASEMPGADLVRLEQIPQGSATLASGRVSLKSLEIEPASTLAAMDIRCSWEAYYQSLPSALRRDLRQSERRLGEFGEWRIRHIRGIEVLAYLATIRDIELTTYKRGEARAFFASPQNCEFLSSFIQMASADTVVLTVLEIEESVIAYGLGFIHAGVYCGYNTSYFEEFKRAAPGKYVISQSIRYAFDQRLKTMDFLRGGSQLKARFGGESMVNYRAVYFSGGLKGAMLRAFVFRLRPFIKRLFLGGVSQEPSRSS